jgi:hypothetical protein
MNYPILKSNAEPYITIIDDNENIFGIELLRYQNIIVQLDKKCIPDMIKILTEIQNEIIHK